MQSCSEVKLPRNFAGFCLGRMSYTTNHNVTIYHHSDGSKTLQISSPLGGSTVQAAYALNSNCQRNRPLCPDIIPGVHGPFSPCSSPAAYCCSSDGGRTCTTAPVPNAPSCPTGQQVSYMPGFYCDN